MQSVKLHLFSQTDKIKLLTIHPTYPIPNSKPQIKTVSASNGSGYHLMSKV